MIKVDNNKELQQVEDNKNIEKKKIDIKSLTEELTNYGTILLNSNHL